MNLTIVEYPDRKLKEKSKKIDKFDKELHELLDAMYPIMMQTNGIGLAAIQVSHAKQVLILNIPEEDGTQPIENLIEMINPIITSKEGEIIYQEGCLSVPSFYEDISRYENITVNFQDRNANTKTLDADGLLSVAIQHEIDHLNGILFIDKLAYSRRKKFEKEYKRMLKEKKTSN
ncbi:peptide deformylase [Sulfurimonas sp.]|uniref:peptide deformylase n=1 Tax=Sulfurimonas sp. TaxID=2022749 RepID=UPI0025D928CE|nr:peptide deformylase [Sulfurimonas sp.]